MIFLVALVGGLIVAAAIAITAIRHEQRQRLDRELAEEDGDFDAYLRAIEWNATGEAIDDRSSG